MLQDLPELCYKSLLEQGMSDLEVKILRVLSKECRFLTDSTVTALKPRDFASSQPGEVGKLFHNLESLDLSEPTKATSTDPVGHQSRLQHLTALTSLKRLVLEEQSESDYTTLTEVLRGLTGLTSFHYLNAKALTDQDIHSLTCLVNLRELALIGTCNSSGEGLGALKDIPHLQSLDLSCCMGVTADGLQAVAMLTQLTAFTSKFMQTHAESRPDLWLSGENPGFQELLSSLTGLQRLDICHSVVPSQYILNQLAGLSRLETLLLDLRTTHPDPTVNGSALLNMQHLRVLGVAGWYLYLTPRAASSGGSPPAALALTELHVAAWESVNHRHLLEAALRGGELRALELSSAHQNHPIGRDGSPSWTRATMLTRLKFQNCHIESLSGLHNLQRLKSLTFYRCSVSSDVVRLSRINKGLEVLEFHGVASFENRCLTKVLSGMSALRTLRIPEAQLIYEGLLGVVAKLTSLQDLDFSYAALKGDADLRRLSALTKLTSLGLAHRVPSTVKKRVPAAIGRNLHCLRTLTLDMGKFREKGLRELTRLTALRFLSLKGCPYVSDKDLSELVVPLSRHSLAEVDVRGCGKFLTARSTAENMGVICCKVRTV